MTNIREIILDILLAVSRDGAYSQNAIHAALEKHVYLTRRDRAFITRVAEGTVERLIELDYIIDAYSQVLHALGAGCLRRQRGGQARPEPRLL